MMLGIVTVCVNGALPSLQVSRKSGGTQPTGAYSSRLDGLRELVPCRFFSHPVDDWRVLITQRSEVQILPPQPIR